MVQLKNILLTTLIVGTLIVGFSAIAFAGKESGTPMVSHASAMTKAMTACGLTSEQQSQFVAELTKINTLGDKPTAKYGMWANNFVSMGDATPGHVSGKNAQFDNMELWYTHDGDNGGTFVGMRTIAATENTPAAEDPFCGSWNYTQFTITGYADQPAINGTWWVWWN